MALWLFHYTLIILLVAVMAAAVCFSAYMVSQKKMNLFLTGAFLFYFLDVVLVFQDEFIFHTVGVDLYPQYIFVRSMLSIVSGGGFLTCFWLLVCDYLDEHRWQMLGLPTITFALLSLILLLAIPESTVQRFFFWSTRALFIVWILGYVLVRYLTSKQEAERDRLWRHRWFYLVLWLLTLGMVAQDVVFQLWLKESYITLGGFTFTTERNFIENFLFLAVAFVSCKKAWQALFMRRERPIEGGSKRQEQEIMENLNVYVSRHKLSAREREVLYMVLIGKDNQNIANEMHLSLSTVKVHVHNILKKTGMPNRAELTRNFWKTS